MPVAICNTCQELVPLKLKHIRKAECICGSNDLTAVSGHLNEAKAGWDYYDRNGAFRKHVPLDIKQFEPVKQ